MEIDISDLTQLEMQNLVDSIYTEYGKGASWLLCLNDTGLEFTVTSAEMGGLACKSVVLK